MDTFPCTHTLEEGTRKSSLREACLMFTLLSPPHEEIDVENDTLITGLSRAQGALLILHHVDIESGLSSVALPSSSAYFSFMTA